jgi:hypothetical protein
MALNNKPELKNYRKQLGIMSPGRNCILDTPAKKPVRKP